MIWQYTEHGSARFLRLVNDRRLILSLFCWTVEEGRMDVESLVLIFDPDLTDFSKVWDELRSETSVYAQELLDLQGRFELLGAIEPHRKEMLYSAASDTTAHRVLLDVASMGGDRSLQVVDAEA